MRIPGKVETLEAKNTKLKKALKKIAKHACNGEAAYDALSCDGYVPKSRWCESCIARAALKGADDE